MYRRTGLYVVIGVTIVAVIVLLFVGVWDASAQDHGDAQVEFFQHGSTLWAYNSGDENLILLLEIDKGIDRQYGHEQFVPPTVLTGLDIPSYLYCNGPETVDVSVIIYHGITPVVSVDRAERESLLVARFNCAWYKRELRPGKPF